jgi:hypothetical protein
MDAHADQDRLAFGAARAGLGHLVGAVMDDGRAGQGKAQRLHHRALQIGLGCAAALHRRTSGIWPVAPSAPGRSGIEDHEQDPRVLALGRGLAMLDQHIAGEPDQMVGMVHDIGDDDARLAQPLVDPVLAHLIALGALAEGQGDAHRNFPGQIPPLYGGR